MCACAWQSECVDVSVCLRVYFSIFSHEYTMICLLWRVCIWHVCVSARMKNRKRASVCLSACLCVCVYLCAFLRTSIFSSREICPVSKEKVSLQSFFPLFLSLFLSHTFSNARSHTHKYHAQTCIEIQRHTSRERWLHTAQNESND